MDKTEAFVNGASNHLKDVDMTEKEKSYNSLQSIEATLRPANANGIARAPHGFGWLSELQIARTKFQVPRPKVLQGKYWWIASNNTDHTCRGQARRK